MLVEVPGGIEEKIVRLRIQGLPPERLDLLDSVLPEYRRRALHLEVQIDDEAPGQPSPEITPSSRLASKLVERLAGKSERESGNPTKGRSESENRIAGESETFDALVELVQDCLPERHR